MKKIIFSILCFFFTVMVACTEPDESVESSTVTVTSSSSNGATEDALVCENSVFSQYVEFCSQQQFLRLDYSFFPDGTGFDFVSQSATLPCNFPEPNVDEHVNVQISVPPEGESCNKLVITFNEANQIFTLDGILIPFNGSYDGLTKDFTLVITADGIKDAVDGTILATNGGKLEDYYDLVLDRH